MTGVDIALEEAGREASRIGTCGDDHELALEPLRARGDGVSSWQDDGLFAVFTSVYAECRAVSMATLTGLSTVIGGTCDGLHAVVRNTGETETANAENASHA
ncbi:hypothetical protein [Nonomuraea sp. NPDC049400]|uniref:hypothetical protein n=1 Tax=Nonomuraea sp. NPDC049400 TaxID=3364352 RepID=UPI00379E2F61